MAATTSGPLFSGMADSILDSFVTSATMALAQQGMAEVHGTLNARIVHPTPYYETQINIRKRRNGLSVNDRGVIYGHWLEGDSPRNGRMRFKGYAAFRKARQYLERQQNRIIKADIDMLMRRLNS